MMENVLNQIPLFSGLNFNEKGFGLEVKKTVVWGGGIVLPNR